MVNYKVQIFSTQKGGCTFEEYEDAYLVDEKNLVFAISDGATEATFSKAWADLLVDKFISNPVEVLTDEWLQSCHKKFSEFISSRELPWHAELKLDQQGSFATLTTLQINIENMTFEVSAIGDSCIFWRDSIGITSFPYRSVDEFSNRPFLLCSKSGYNEESLQNQNYDIRTISEPLTFYMATDALSCWFIDSYQKGEEPWIILDAITTDSEFESLITELRIIGAIKNDDVTFIKISEI